MNKPNYAGPEYQMLHAKVSRSLALLFWRRSLKAFLPYKFVVVILVMRLIEKAVLEKNVFENGGRTTDEQRTMAIL